MKGKKNNLVKWVFAVHLLIAALIALPVSFSSCRTREIEAIPVRMIQEAPSPNAAVQQKQQEPSPAEPSREEPPPQKEPDPSPAEQARETSPEKPRPKERLRTAEEIRKSARLDPVTPTKPQRQSTPKIDTSQMEERLRQRVKRYSTDVASAQYNPAKSTDAALERYLGVISDILTRRWSQPTRRETGGEKPVAGVQFTIAADGKVTRARLVRPSNNAAMDASINQLINKTERLPPPKGYGVRDRELTVTINFELGM